MRVKYLVDAEPYNKGDVIDIADDRGEELVAHEIAEEVDRNTPIRSASTTVDAEKAAAEAEDAERAALQKQANSIGREVTGTVGGEEVTVKPAKEKPAAKTTKSGGKKSK